MGDKEPARCLVAPDGFSLCARLRTHHLGDFSRVVLQVKVRGHVSAFGCNGIQKKGSLVSLKTKEPLRQNVVEPATSLYRAEEFGFPLRDGIYGLTGWTSLKSEAHFARDQRSVFSQPVETL